MTKRRDEGNFSHFVPFSQHTEHLAGRVERIHFQSDEFRPADPRPEEQADDEPPQPVLVKRYRRFAFRGRSIAEKNLQFILTGPMIGGGEIRFHRLFRIELRQAFLHLGPLDVPGRIGIQHPFLHQEAAESAQYRHMLMHRPRLHPPAHAVRLVPPQQGRDHRLHNLPFAEPRIILQDIPVDVLRPRRIPPDVPDICKVRVDHDEGIISPG